MALIKNYMMQCSAEIQGILGKYNESKQSLDLELKKNMDSKKEIEECMTRERELNITCQTLTTQTNKQSSSLERLQLALNNLEKDQFNLQNNLSKTKDDKNTIAHELSNLNN